VHNATSIQNETVQDVSQVLHIVGKKVILTYGGKGTCVRDMSHCSGITIQFWGHFNIKNDQDFLKLFETDEDY